MVKREVFPRKLLRLLNDVQATYVQWCDAVENGVHVLVTDTDAFDAAFNEADAKNAHTNTEKQLRVWGFRRLLPGSGYTNPLVCGTQYEHALLTCRRREDDYKLFKRDAKVTAATNACRKRPADAPPRAVGRPRRAPKIDDIHTAVVTCEQSLTSGCTDIVPAQSHTDEFMPLFEIPVTCVAQPLTTQSQHQQPSAYYTVPTTSTQPESVFDDLDISLAIGLDDVMIEPLNGLDDDDTQLSCNHDIQQNDEVLSTCRWEALKQQAHDEQLEMQT